MKKFYLSGCNSMCFCSVSANLYYMSTVEAQTQPNKIQKVSQHSFILSTAQKPKPSSVTTISFEIAVDNFRLLSEGSLWDKLLQNSQLRFLFPLP